MSFGLIVLISSFADAHYEKDWLEVNEDAEPTPGKALSTPASAPVNSAPSSPPTSVPAGGKKISDTDKSRVAVASLKKKASSMYKGFKNMFGNKKKPPTNAAEAKSPPARWMNAMKTCEGEVENKIKKKSSMSDKDIKEAMAQCLKKREAFSLGGMFSGAKKAIGDAYDSTKKAARKHAESIDNIKKSSKPVKPATSSKPAPTLNFEAYDANNDGAIDFEEFKAMMEGGGCGQFGYWSCDSATSGGGPICKWCGNMFSGTCRNKQYLGC